MIEALALHKQFRPVTAVHDLSFVVGDGEIFGLLGPNGAGKTTSVRMLSGLIAPTSGGARINGMELGRDSQRIRAITGVLTEAPGLHDKLTARANLAYYGRLYGLRGATLRRATLRRAKLRRQRLHLPSRLRCWAQVPKQTPWVPRSASAAIA